MPNSECEGVLLQSISSSSSTLPLRIITQYSSSNAPNMQSPTRPTTLGVCVSSGENVSDMKTTFSIRTPFPNDGGNQQWTVKAVDSIEFEKILGHIGNNGSTPVTPTSFLNPHNITEDQELFADNFSRTLTKVQAEQEGWDTASQAPVSCANTILVTQHSQPQSKPQPLGAIKCFSVDSELPICYLDGRFSPPVTDRDNVVRALDNDNSRSSSGGSGSRCVPDTVVPDTKQHCIGSDSVVIRLSSGVNPNDQTSTSSTLPLTDRPLIIPTSHTLTSSSCPVPLIPSSTIISSSRSPLLSSSTSKAASQSDETKASHSLITSICKPETCQPNLAFHVSASKVEDTANVQWASSLPTILSIASGLQQLTGNTSSDTTASIAHYEDGAIYKPILSSLVCEDGTNSHLEDAASVSDNLSPHSGHPQVIVRYAAPEQNLSVLSSNNMTGSTVASVRTCNNNLLPSLVVSPSCASHQNNLRTALGELYTSMRPTDASALGLIRTPSVSSVAVDCELKSTPLTILVDAAGQPIMTASSGSAAVPLRISPQDGSASPKSVFGDAHFGTLLINSDAQLQQLTTLYPALTGTSLTQGSTDSDTLIDCATKHHPHALLLQSTPGVAAAVAGLNLIANRPINDGNGPTSLQSGTVSLVNSMDISMNEFNRSTSLNDSHPIILRSALPPSPSLGPYCETTLQRLGRSEGDLPFEVDTPKQSITPGHHPSYVVSFSESAQPLSSTLLMSSNSRRNKRLASNGRRSRVTTTECPNLNPVSLSSDMTTVVYSSSAMDATGVTHLQSGLKRLKNCEDPISVVSHTPQSSAPTHLVNASSVSGQSFVPGIPPELFLHEAHHPTHARIDHLTGVWDDMDEIVSTNSGSLGTDVGVKDKHGGTTLSEGLDQHQMKIERKRARNRVAARRCRERKLSLISSLEHQVAERDAYVRKLEDMLNRFRTEGSRLRAHMELLSNTYPTLKAELNHYPFLFHQSAPVSDSLTEGTPSKTELFDELDARRFSQH